LESDVLFDTSQAFGERIIGRKYEEMERACID
jgi:hypothetical protein